MTSPQKHATSGIAIRPGDALIVVDVQSDFLPGGALGVPEGDAVVPALNRHIDAFMAADRPVILTRDWHPAKHCSFRPQGGPWPTHCVAGTDGARFASGLKVPERAWIISKGTDPDREAYSGFQGTDLEARLRDAAIERVFVGGLATDYCVKATVDDAIDRGFEVNLLEDSIRSVDAQAGDGRRAIEAMHRAGARPVGAGALRD